MCIRDSQEGSTFAFDFSGDDTERAKLLAQMVAAELRPVEFRATETDLEDIFMQMTKGEVQ